MGCIHGDILQFLYKSIIKGRLWRMFCVVKRNALIIKMVCVPQKWLNMTAYVKHILLVAVQVKVIMAYVLDHMEN